MGEEKGKRTNRFCSPEFPFYFHWRESEIKREGEGAGEKKRKEKKKKLICLQTRNGVHAEIAGGFGLESAAATVCTATFAPFILCLLNK